MLNASDSPAEPSAGDAQESHAALLRRIDMHVVDIWPVLFALYGLPAKPLMGGVALLLAAAGVSLLLLLSRIR
jgi:hypothetical protein